MLATFLATLEQMCRILLLLSIGFAFNKLRLVPKTAENILSRFVTMLFLPCLLFYSNVMECNADSLMDNLGLVMIGTVFCLASIGISCPLGKILGGKDLYQQGVCRYAVSFPNTGAFGTPLTLAFFGTSGLFLFNLFNFVQGILIYTWGILQLQFSNGKLSFMSSLKKCLNPATVFSTLGLLLGILGAKAWFPDIVIKTVGDIGNCYVIVGLLLTGYTIADYPFGQVFGNLKIWLYVLLRLIVIPVVFAAVAILCGAPLMTCILVVLTYAAPCGMNPVIYAAAYGEDCEMGAGMVLQSSLCSVVTIPVMYALVQQLAA